ncbi:MAG: sigma-54 dependent transcriptional regulator [Thermodesulfobacteriota bacterium]|nr:sigma-54 dependent transcriptional regulator [Thermodesulfobacteriota bacterium]
MASVLIIDDDNMFNEMLSLKVRQLGHEAATAVTLEQGLKEASSGGFDIVYLDVRMPDGNGLDILPKIQEGSSPPEVIIITGAGDPDGAELAVENGAWDYIEKPSSIEAMTLPLIRAIQYREERSAGKTNVALKREGIIGKSIQLKSCLDLLAKAANSNTNVLITGETGTGKELFASAIHENGLRSNGNFVVVDCTVLPETLVESMLFGYEKGAFTGADRANEGLIMQSDGGTLFLDEVGELPLNVQKAFLRVIDEHSFRPLSCKREIKSDFRLVSATNRNLDEMVQRGKFRKDLLFRLRSLVIHLPPLREHTEDIKELTLHYIAKLCELYNIGIKGGSSDFFEVLEEYTWPGNVRELINTIERAIAVAQNEPTLFPKHLAKEIRIQVARALMNKKKSTKEDELGMVNESGKLSTMKDFRELTVSDAEKKYLEKLMSLTKGNIKKACSMSGLSRPRLYALLKKYEIPKKP